MSSANGITRSRFIALSVLMTIMWSALLASWLTVTPPFRTPDAPNHFNSVMRLVHGGGWPEPMTAPMHPDTIAAMAEASVIPRGTDNPSMFHVTTLQGTTLQGTGPRFISEDPLAHEDRTRFRFNQASATSHNDQMTQHPPGYYQLSAQTMKALGGAHWRWDQQYLWMAFISLVLSIPIVPLSIFTIRQFGLSRLTALLGTLPIMAVPQVAHIGAAVGNDSFTMVCGAAVLAASAYLMRVGITTRSTLAIGVVCGIAFLSKGNVLVMALTVLLALIAGARTSLASTSGHIARLPQRWAGAFARGALPASVLAFIIGGWWWLRNIILYGSLQPEGMRPFITSWGDDTPTIREAVIGAYGRFSRTLWGNFGWLERPLPSPIIHGLTIALVVLIIAGLIIAIRSRLRIGTTPVGIALGIFLASVAAMLVLMFRSTWKAYLVTGLIGGSQGRYSYPWLVALCVPVAFVIAAIIARSRVIRLGFTALWTLACAAFAGAGWLYWAVACYPSSNPVSFPYVSPTLWSRFGLVYAPWGIAALVVSTGLGLVIFVMLIRAAAYPDEDLREEAAATLSGEHRGRHAA